MTETGKFTPKKVDITLTPDFNQYTFVANVKVHVDVSGSVKDFDFKISKDLDVERVSFIQASHIFRGNPNSLGHVATIKFDKKTETVHVTLLTEINAESIKEGGYFEVEYNGKIGEKGANKGLFRLDALTFDTNLKNGNAYALLPVLADVPVLVTLTVITPYRAGVDTKLDAGEHTDAPGGQLFANEFNSGETKIKLSDLHFKINAPTFLKLD
ncbi:unnamed protein product [Caenorhabditis sp. 36 PRJEB53466]|nr:unnamed protein product [Caenorhabditis sp. 36 PRJEB53466]